MRQLSDSVWQVRGTSWVWDEEARNQICVASEVWSLRQFLRAKGQWPDDLPSNGGRTLVVAGLDGSLDLLAPTDAETWLADTIKPAAVLSFQDEWGSDGALVFWLPGGLHRIRANAATDEVSWTATRPTGIRSTLAASCGAKPTSTRRRFCCATAVGPLVCSTLRIT